jgi:ABC-type sugar transport system ATPase subunit
MRRKIRKAAIARGVFMSAKDRANNAVIADFDITRNITLPFLARYSNACLFHQTALGTSAAPQTR